MNFTPDPRAVSPRRRIWNHSLMECGIILRNGEQLLLAAVIPFVVLVGGKIADGRYGIDFPHFPPSIIAMVLWSSGLTSLAIATAFERRYNVLERLAATPLGKEGLLIGKGISIAIIALGQVVTTLLVAAFLGWRAQYTLASSVLGLFSGFVCLIAFVSIGLALACAFRPETTLALANLLFMAGLPAGILLPVSSIPAWIQLPVSLLPTAAIGTSMRAAAAGQVVWQPLLVGMVWAALSALWARKVFKWIS